MRGEPRAHGAQERRDRGTEAAGGQTVTLASKAPPFFVSPHPTLPPSKEPALLVKESRVPTRLRAPRPLQGRPAPGKHPHLSLDPRFDAAPPPRRLVGTRRCPDAPRFLPGLWEELREGRETAPSAASETSSRAAGAVGKGSGSGEQGKGRAREREKKEGETRIGTLALYPPLTSNMCF